MVLDSDPQLCQHYPSIGSVKRMSRIETWKRKQAVTAGL